jgi:hypothetical protein
LVADFAAVGALAGFAAVGWIVASGFFAAFALAPEEAGAGLVFLAIVGPPRAAGAPPRVPARSFVWPNLRLRASVFRMPAIIGSTSAADAGSQRSLGRAALCAALVVATAACASPPKFGPFGMGGVDPNSPVAAEVTQAEHTPGGYPKLSATPAIPTDIRPVTAWREAVLAVKADRVATDRQAAAIPFTLNNTQTWAAQTRGRVDPGEAHGAPAQTQAQAEAFAAQERARATPPSSSK